MTLPNFLVIGAYKSGTTSLHYYLAQHPEIFIPEIKEPNFFAFADVTNSTHPAYPASIKTYAQYGALFDAADGTRAIGEVSPEYMTTPTSAQKIFDTLPGVKIIAILRNPVDRAYSDYLMYRRNGREKETDFIKALELQEQRYKNGVSTGYYVRTGLYAEQLIPYYDLFPHEKIKVFLFEDLIADQVAVLRELFAFLEVDSGFIPPRMEVHNRSGIATNRLIQMLNSYGLRKLLAPLPKFALRTALRRRVEKSLTKPPMPATAKHILLEIYRDDILALQKLIERDLSSWLNPDIH